MKFFAIAVASLAFVVSVIAGSDFVADSSGSNVCDMQWFYCPRDSQCNTYRMSVQSVTLMAGDGKTRMIPANITVGTKLTLSVIGQTVYTEVPPTATYKTLYVNGKTDPDAAGVLADAVTLDGKGGFEFTISLPFVKDFTIGTQFELGINANDRENGDGVFCIEIADIEYVNVLNRSGASSPFEQYCDDGKNGTFTKHTSNIVPADVAGSGSCSDPTPTPTTTPTPPTPTTTPKPTPTTTPPPTTTPKPTPTTTPPPTTTPTPEPLGTPVGQYDGNFTVSSTNATTKNTTNVSFAVEIQFLPKSKGAKSGGTLDLAIARDGQDADRCKKQEYNVTAGSTPNVTHVILTKVADQENCVHKMFKADGIHVNSIKYDKAKNTLSMVVATGNATQAVTLDHKNEPTPSPSPAPSHKSSDTWGNTYQYIFWVFLVLFILLCIFVGVCYWRNLLCFASSSTSDSDLSTYQLMEGKEDE